MEWALHGIAALLWVAALLVFGQSGVWVQFGDQCRGRVLALSGALLAATAFILQVLA